MKILGFENLTTCYRWTDWRPFWLHFHSSLVCRRHPAPPPHAARWRVYQRLCLKDFQAAAPALLHIHLRCQAHKHGLDCGKVGDELNLKRLSYLWIWVSEKSYHHKDNLCLCDRADESIRHLRPRPTRKRGRKRRGSNHFCPVSCMMMK